jgi:hypothetical protein
MPSSKFFGAAVIAGVFVAQSLHGVALAATNVASASTKSGTFTEIAFVGGNGTYTAGSDKVVVKDGLITVNGVSYGKISSRSQVQYTIRNGKKTLTVDGVERKPVK